MSVELLAATATDTVIIETLLDDYLQELSCHRDVPVGATDSASYPYLSLYWSEPGRHPFLIRLQNDHNDHNKIVGFVLVRDPTSTKSSVFEVAEFYVRPENRRQGIGRAAILAMWRLFPGEWELQVHAQDSAAIRFWSACVEAITKNGPVVSHVQADDGRRLQYNFSTQEDGSRSCICYQ